MADSGRFCGSSRPRRGLHPTCTTPGALATIPPAKVRQTVPVLPADCKPAPYSSSGQPAKRRAGRFVCCLLNQDHSEGRLTLHSPARSLNARFGISLNSKNATIARLAATLRLSRLREAKLCLLPAWTTRYSVFELKFVLKFRGQPISLRIQLLQINCPNFQYKNDKICHCSHL